MQDLQLLLSRLDSECTAYLEAASRFCMQQHHPEVTPAHLVLVMLDSHDKPLNRLLKTSNIRAEDWIRYLLKLTDEYDNEHAGKPVFSSALLDWFSTTLNSMEHGNSNVPVTQQDLLVSLMNNPAATGLSRLPGAELVTQSAISDYFSYQHERDEGHDRSHNDSQEHGQNRNQAPHHETVMEAGNDAAADPDATVIMTDDELTTSVKTSAQPEAPPDIAGYSNIEKIGDGGMASVFRARHIGLDRDVAIKVLKPEFFSNSDDDNTTERFLREARIVAQLAHPNIVQIYDISHQDKLTYIAMELVTGGELSELVDTGPGLI